MDKVDNFSGEGFRIGDIYALTNGRSTEMIPRSEISYVSAKYKSQPILILFGILLVLFGLFSITNGSGATAVGVMAVAVGAFLIVAYFFTRRVGIVVASSGGQLFIESRGKRRFALLEEIYADLRARS